MGRMVREERAVELSRFELRTGGMVPRGRRKRARATTVLRISGEKFRQRGGAVGLEIEGGRRGDGGGFIAAVRH
jgi:hypothetical protein